jgi:hypothetical protein
MPPIRIKWPQEAEPQPRGAEARTLAALEDTCDLDFYDEPLNEVIAAIAQRHGIQTHIDRKALDKRGVSVDALITRTLRGITLKAALKLMLDELDLAYVVRDEVLLVTSKTEAENLLIVKVYPVFDLVVRRPDASRLKPALDFKSLNEAITSNLAPTTWDEVGGPGVIEEFTNSGALVISQTPAIHEQIAAFLQALREAAAAP